MYGKNKGKETKVENVGNSIDREKLRQLIIEAFYATRSVAGQKIILVLGNTGVGKSTMINYLLDCPMQEEVSDDGLPRIGVEAGKERAKIGHEMTRSTTMYPEAFLSETGLCYCDCPGFGETRGIEARITTAIATKIALNSVKEVRSIIVTIEDSDFTSGKARGLRDAFETLQWFFSNPDGSIVLDKKTLNVSLICAITKFDQRIKYKVRFENMRKIARDTGDRELEFMCDLILNGTDRIVLVDPLDKGESRNAITNLILEAQAIPPKYFGFPADANMRQELRELLSDIVVNGQHILDTIVHSPNEIRMLKAKSMEEKEKLDELEQRLTEVTNLKIDSDSEGTKRVEQLIRERQLRLKEASSQKTTVAHQMRTVQDSLAKLNTSAPVVHVRETFDEKQVFGIVKKGVRNTKILNYSGVPFIRAEQHSVGEGAEFTSEVSDPRDGTYRVTYITGPDIYGIGTITIYVAMNNIPENARLIAQRKRELLSLEADVAKLKNDIVELEEGTRNLENKLIEIFKYNAETAEERKQLMIQIYSKEKSEVDYILRETNDKLSALLNAYRDARDDFPKQRDAFELVRKIASVIGKECSIQVIQFLDMYVQYCTSERGEASSSSSSRQTDFFAHTGQTYSNISSAADVSSGIDPALVASASTPGRKL